MPRVVVFHRLQVDADDLAATNSIKQVGEVERRAAKGRARLDDELGLQLPDQFGVQVQIAGPLPRLDAHIGGTTPRATVSSSVISELVKFVDDHLFMASRTSNRFVIDPSLATS